MLQLHLALGFVFVFVFLIQFQCIKTLTHPSDIKALQAFKASVKPSTIPSYACLAGWDFSLDPCSVPHRTHFVCGITCSTDSTRVISLVLDPVGYSGTLTPLLSTLTELIHLDLSDNAFYGPIPSTLSSLTKLETLTIRSNSLSGSVPPPLTKLSSLRTLEISHNALTGSLPDSLNSLTNLQVLDFSYNKLTGALPKLPPNLVTLALKSNSLTGSLAQSSFQGLNKLQIVELSDNMLSGVLQGWLLLLPSLQQVDLANNSFTRVEIWKPRGCKTNLVSLDLGLNKIEGSLPVDLVLFSSLSVLILRNNQFDGPIPWQYGNRKALRRLFLEGNFLSGGVPATFWSSNKELSGSFADNCLRSCPVSSALCSSPQKPNRICKQFYRKKPRPNF